MQRSARRIAVGTTILVLAACGRQVRMDGVRYDAGDDAILVASLMPRCGCMTLANIRGSGGIEVVSLLDGQEAGRLVLGAGQEHTEKFDWAGSEASDRYRVVAHTLRTDGSRGEQLKPISGYLRFTRSTDTPCNDTACAFGPLALSAAVNGPAQR